MVSPGGAGNPRGDASMLTENQRDAQNGVRRRSGVARPH
jgi:hypothetical protein